MKCLGAVLGGIFACFALRAANPGDEVIVVYNNHVPESRAIAEYYALKRQVPTNQVFGMDLPTGEGMSRGEYETMLQLPLAKAIKDNQLWHFESELVPATNDRPQKVIWKVDKTKIRYAALCYGVPVFIMEDPMHQDEGQQKVRPEARRNEAAVDSELALLPLINETIPLNGSSCNPLFGTTNLSL